MGHQEAAVLHVTTDGVAHYIVAEPKSLGDLKDPLDAVGELAPVRPEAQLDDPAASGEVKDSLLASLLFESVVDLIFDVDVLFLIWWRGIWVDSRLAPSNASSRL